MPDRESTQTQNPDPRCPLCRRPAVAQFRPFCSRRCADADLGSWLTGEYRVPGPGLEPEPDREDGEG